MTSVSRPLLLPCNVSELDTIITLSILYHSNPFVSINELNIVLNGTCFVEIVTGAEKIVTANNVKAISERYCLENIAQICTVEIDIN